MNDNYKIHPDNPHYGSLMFIDSSVDTGDISEQLSDKAIQEKIRDEYLKDSTVTILLLGKETKHRKHIDWELYSSMYNGKVNKKSGILVINLPTIKKDSPFFIAGHGEKEIYPECASWTPINKREEFENRLPYMPDRIIDNLLNPNVKISVTQWDKIIDPKILKCFIDITFRDRLNCEYNLKTPMRRQNFNPKNNM